MRRFSIRFAFQSFLALLLFQFSTSSWADLESAKKAYESGDYEAALKELKPLAAAGDPVAQRVMGDMYANGKGIEKDDEQAFSWHSKAAAQGDPAAQKALRDSYANGKGTEKNSLMAAYWEWKYAQSHATKAKSQLIKEMAKNEPFGTNIYGANETQADEFNIPLEDRRLFPCRPEYPKAALEKKQEGTAEVLLLAEADGKVFDVVIAKSSGWPLLDEAAASALSHCVFAPYPVAGVLPFNVTRIRYVWKIN